MISLNQSPKVILEANKSSLKSQIALSFTQIASILGIVILISIFFASLNLSIGIYLRTYKEAQTYMAHLSIICMIPSYFTYTIDLNDISLNHISVPILNIICVLKEILSGIFNVSHISFLIAWIAIYIFASFLLTIKLFKKKCYI